MAHRTQAVIVGVGMIGSVHVAAIRGVGATVRGVVGSTPGAVRVTQHRALNRLRRIVMAVDVPDAHLDEE